jgi:hypothetical protein
MQQLRRVLRGTVTAAIILAVPVFAVCVFASSAATQTVAINPGDDPLANGLSTFRKAPARRAPAPVRPAKVGETPAEVQAQEWVATGGGGGSGGSPKG